MEGFFVSNCVIETMSTHWNEIIILLMTRLLALQIYIAGYVFMSLFIVPLFEGEIKIIH